jgi:hypothetical protein
VVRLYGLRNWVEQGYKQVKQELGWADFMVRSDRAIRRHWHLVCCAFSFCWQAWFAEAGIGIRLAPATQAETSASVISAVPAGPSAGRGENGDQFKTKRAGARSHLASNTPSSALLAGSVDVPLALVASMVNGATTPRDPGPSPRRGNGASSPHLYPGVTNYRGKMLVKYPAVES